MSARDDLLKMPGLFCGETDERRREWIERIEAETRAELGRALSGAAHDLAILRAQIATLAKIVQFSREFLVEHDAFVAIPLPPADPTLHFAQAARMKEAAGVLRDAFKALDAHPLAMLDPVTTCPVCGSRDHHTVIGHESIPDHRFEPGR